MTCSYCFTRGMILVMFPRSPRTESKHSLSIRRDFKPDHSSRLVSCVTGECKLYHTLLNHPGFFAFLTLVCTGDLRGATRIPN